MAVATKTPEKHDAAEKHEAAEKHDIAVKDTAPPEQKDMLPGREPPILKDLGPIQFATPVGVDELTLDPDAVQGSRHVGPLLSGAPEDGAAGIAVLQKRVKISTVQHGNFSVPVRFPASSILLNYTVQIQQSYNGTLAKVNLGTTLNGTDIANVDVTVAPTQLTSNITSVLGSTWTIYLSQVIGAGGTAGKSTVLVSYSVPAKTLPS